ncbi:hypothetical protein [Mesorhizobium sp. M0146]|uniref:hypothetical protein n=1 Tax=Mesorhizobium sp. M0146 TaxID=2956896 RepID=UPI003339E021
MSRRIKIVFFFQRQSNDGVGLIGFQANEASFKFRGVAHRGIVEPFQRLGSSPYPARQRELRHNQIETAEDRRSSRSAGPARALRSDIENWTKDCQLNLYAERL